MGMVNVVCSNIIEHNSKFMFVKEAKAIAAGRYSLPAGKLEFGETIIAGAKREAKEETGLEIEPVKLIGIYQRPRSNEDSNTTVFCFLSRVIGGQITPTVEHPEIKFLSIEEIAQLEQNHGLRARYMLPAIKDYLAGRGVEMSFLTILE